MKSLFFVVLASLIFSTSVHATNLSCAEVKQEIAEKGFFYFNRVRVAANDESNCPEKSPFYGYNYAYIDLHPAYERVGDGSWCFVWMCEYVKAGK